MDFTIEHDKDGYTRIYADDKELDRMLDYRISSDRTITIQLDADSIKHKSVETFCDVLRENEFDEKEKRQYEFEVQKEEQRRDRIKIGLKVATMVVELSALAVLIAGVVLKLQQ